MQGMVKAAHYAPCTQKKQPSGCLRYAVMSTPPVSPALSCR